MANCDSGRITKGVGGEYTILLDDNSEVLAKPRGIVMNLFLGKLSTKTMVIKAYKYKK